MKQNETKLTKNQTMKIKSKRQQTMKSEIDAIEEISDSLSVANN